MKKLFILSLVLLVLAFPMVNASDYELEIEVDNNRIRQGEVATFNISLTNLGTNDRVYSIGLGPSASAFWIISPSSFAVPAGQTRDLTLRLFPSQSLSPSLYNLELMVRSAGLDSTTVNAQVRLLAEGYVSGFVPSLALNVRTAESINPTNPMRINLELNNRNQRQLNNLSVNIVSDLFESSLALNVDPLQRLSREVQVNLDPMQAPGVYTARVTIFYPGTGNIIADEVLEFTVGEYSNIESSRTTEETVLTTTTQIVVKNQGNVQREAEILVDTNWLSSIFTSSSDSVSRIKVDGERKILWTPLVGVDEEQSLVLKTNYWTLVIIIMLLLIAVISYYVFRSPIVIRKQISVIKDEQGVSEMKVRLFVKNRSSKKIYSLSITDKLPRITQYIESNQLGYVKPDKVNNTRAKGTILYWSFDSLDSLEERILAYKLKSNLKIVGDLSLPKSRVKFESGSGGERITTSCKPTFKR